ncbi:MAG: trypsin-like serine protease [Deltaproteobacteria bacterium]|nr:trypsin-like serine protease [Deltaproteobacteria bacterium]
MTRYPAAQCSVFAFTLTLTLTLSLAACGGGLDDVEDPGELDTTTDELVGGTVTTLRPEVGQYFAASAFGGGQCTATLIHPRYVLTNAHCIAYFSPSVLSSAGWGSFAAGGQSFRVDRVHAFTRFLTEYTASASRTTDVALLRLETPVPATVATPARLADTPPAVGQAATTFGFGCADRSRASTGSKRYFVFTYGQATQAICKGDSGGPVFVGDQNANGRMWALNSSYSASTGNDTFADVVALKPQIEAQILQWGDGPLEYGFSRGGGVYATSTQPDAEACRSVCRADPSCRAFKYRDRVAPLAIDNHRCSLLGAAGEMTPSPSYISGLPSAVSPNLTFDGAADTTLTGISNAGLCAAECGVRRSCWQWRWRAPSTCELSATVAPLVPCSGCAAGTKQQSRESNIDRSGNDYASFSISDPLLCEFACAIDYRCKAYTHVQAGIVGSSARCFLKSARGTPTTLQGATSGVRRGLEVNTDRPGAAYADFTLPDATPERCQARCANDSNCRTWTYRPAPSPTSSPRCLLRSTVPARYSTVNMVSGSFDGAATWLRADDTDVVGGTAYSSWEWTRVEGPIQGTSTWVHATADSCEASCRSQQATLGCHTWTFQSANEDRRALCTLRNGNRVTSTRLTHNSVSGVRGLEFFP